MVAKDHKVLFGAASHWYLDCGFGTFLDPNASNSQTTTKSQYLEWCSLFKNWRQVYSYDPLDGISDDEALLVIGGEVHLWAKLTDSVSFDSKL